VKLTQYLQKFLTEVVPTLAPRTQLDYTRALHILDKRFGDLEADALKPKDIGLFLQSYPGKTQGNRIVAVLSSVYGHIIGSWWGAEMNPCFQVKRNKERPRQRYVTDEEFNAVYELASRPLRVAMDLALLTGQRRADILKLQWRDISPRGVLFEQGKTGRRLLVEMSPALQAVLTRAKTIQPLGVTVLRTTRGLPFCANTFADLWQQLMNQALADGVIYYRFTFHDLRAKSVSDSPTIAEAYERAGHTSLTVTRGTYDRGTRKVKPLR
jgi:integrase